MGIIASPFNSTNHFSASTLKLVAAAGLPKAVTTVTKSDSIPVKKLQPGPPELSDAALLEIRKLKARDTQLQQHVQAHHAASAGVDVSNAAFTYQRGPDGVNYAVAGDVSIDTSPGRTPEDTLARAEMIRDVALAPADPSAADRRVAAQAQQIAQQASAEILQQRGKQQPDVKQAYDNSSPAIKRIDTFV